MTSEGQQMPDGSVTEPADAILLATSGLARVDMADRIDHTFSTSEMLPAVGQGIVAVECAETNWQVRDYLARIDNADARARAEAEREVLWVLDGHCNSPIAAHATIDGDVMKIEAAVMSLDGNTILRESGNGRSALPAGTGPSRSTRPARYRCRQADCRDTGVKRPVRFLHPAA